MCDWCDEAEQKEQDVSPPEDTTVNEEQDELDTQLALVAGEEEAAEEIEYPEPIWLPGQSFPLFIGDAEDVIDKVKDMGYGFFYVLGSYKEKYETKTGNSVTYKWTDPEPRIFKVVTNGVGYAIDAVQDATLNLANITPTAYFKLPKIPFEMILKLDSFFRQVDKKHSTEAIVILTYDPKEGGQEGWGLLVPKQTNTAGHCKYDPQSIVDELDDLNEGREFDERIFSAGTAHSHPGMSAYASHTDHNDQMGNDGIHITFGWNKNSNVTDHYVELQMGGSAYILPPEQAFTDAPEPPQFPEVDEWTKRVSKAGGANPTQGTWKSGNGPSSGPVTSSQWSSYDPKRDPNAHYDQNQHPFKLPEGCPDPRSFTILARLLDDQEKKCPVCSNFLRGDAVNRRRCWDCMSYFIMPDETLDDVVAVRDKEEAPTFELLPERAEKSIALWDRWLVDQKVVSKTETLHTVVTSGKVQAP